MPTEQPWNFPANSHIVAAIAGSKTPPSSPAFQHRIIIFIASNSHEGIIMKKHLAAAALTLAFAAPAAAQGISQGADNTSGSRIARPAPVTAQTTPEATAAAAKESIAAAKKLGKVPDRNTLQLLLAAETALKDEAGIADAIEEEAADYNAPADWVQIIDMTFGTSGLRDQDAIWLGRLMFVVGAPVSSNDAGMVGAVASEHAYFGDAVNAKAHGGAVDPDPAPRADADKKTMPQQIAAEQAQDGAYNAKLAEALYSYGMYPEAEAAARLAIQKGGNPDASEAPMVLGQALTAEGKYADAITAFGQVSGGGPATPRIARLWTDYAKIKKK
jgi:TolA-binding protein